MTKKCLGCGAVFQSGNPLSEGFIEEENYEKSIICKRCFRIKNYGEYSIVNKDKEDYEKIFENIKNKKDLVLFLCDIFTLDDTLEYLNGFKGPVILVITKKDLLPKSVKESKLLDYIKKNYNLNAIGVIFVSSIKNYNLDRLKNVILKYKTSNNVYLVGNTNAGKSTLINGIIKAYGKRDTLITTSSLPATTLEVMEIKIDDNLTLIDTPGLVTNDNYLTDLEPLEVKRISPKVDYLSNYKNSFTLYLSNEIKVERINLNTNDKMRNLNKTSFDLENNKDIVISGLLFCKITKKANVNIYTKNNVKVYQRDNLI